MASPSARAVTSILLLGVGTALLCTPPCLGSPGGTSSLPRLRIDPAEISISGLSSGADFASQFQVAYSSLLRGSGIFAGQAYRCAVTAFPGESLVPQCCGTQEGCTNPGCTERTPSPNVPWCDGCEGGQVVSYDHCKRHPDLVNMSMLTGNTRSHAQANLIDDVRHLNGSNVYLYRGTKDTCYLPGSLKVVESFFEAFHANVLFNHTTPSAHAWPTADYGEPCGHGVIENCGYDGPGAALQHIYGGELSPPVAANASRLVQYDQTPYMSSDNNGTAYYNETTPRATGLAPTGYIYVPTACSTGQAVACKLHLSLHGCSVNEYYDEAIHHLGFQRWGEANNIVIVFPRIQPQYGSCRCRT